jgi:hypothetical protein
MVNIRKAIDPFCKKRLLEIAHTLGFLGWSVLTKDDIVRNLSKKKSFEKALESLRTDELKSICLELGLKPGGVKRQDYIDRLTGKRLMPSHTNRRQRDLSVPTTKQRDR